MTNLDDDLAAARQRLRDHIAACAVEELEQSPYHADPWNKYAADCELIAWDAVQQELKGGDK